MNKWMNWMIELNERIDKCTNLPRIMLDSEQMKEQRTEWLIEWLKEWIDKWTHLALEDSSAPKSTGAGAPKRPASTPAGAAKKAARNAAAANKSPDVGRTPRRRGEKDASLAPTAGAIVRITVFGFVFCVLFFGLFTTAFSVLPVCSDFFLFLF